MTTILAFLVIASIAYYCYTYGVWARENQYYRGYIGILIVAVFTLTLPIGVWVYHNFFR